MPLINLAIVFKLHIFGVCWSFCFLLVAPTVERLHSFYRGASKPSQATSTSEFQRRRLGCFGLEECPWKQQSSWLVSESTTKKYGAICCWLLNKSGLTSKDIFDSKAWLCFFSCVFFFTFYHGEITINPPFERICFTCSKHLKQIQVIGIWGYPQCNSPRRWRDCGNYSGTTMVSNLWKMARFLCCWGGGVTLKLPWVDSCWNHKNVKQWWPLISCWLMFDWLVLVR